MEILKFRFFAFKLIASFCRELCMQLNLNYLHMLLFNKETRKDSHSFIKFEKCLKHGIFVFLKKGFLGQFCEEICENSQVAFYLQTYYRSHIAVLPNS
jgi:hypothetical protein